MAGEAVDEEHEGEAEDEGEADVEGWELVVFGLRGIIAAVTVRDIIVVVMVGGGGGDGFYALGDNDYKT